MILDDETISYTTSERGKLMLVFKGFPFLKEKTFKNKVSWVCRQKTALHCKVRLTQDKNANKIVYNHDITHNHGKITERRRTGCLKAERVLHGLKPEYRKNKIIDD